MEPKNYNTVGGSLLHCVDAYYNKTASGRIPLSFAYKHNASNYKLECEKAVARLNADLLQLWPVSRDRTRGYLWLAEGNVALYIMLSSYLKLSIVKIKFKRNYGQHDKKLCKDRVMRWCRYYLLCPCFPPLLSVVLARHTLCKCMKLGCEWEATSRQQLLFWNCTLLKT